MQDSIVKLAASLGATLGAYSLYKLIEVFYNQWMSPLMTLPCPPRPSLLWGNMKQIMEPGNPVVHEGWPKDYGKTIRVGGMFGLYRLYTTDLKALGHILARSDIYGKAEPTRYALREILGDGLVVVQGEKHKVQRRVMNPAFSATAVREMTGAFMQKAIMLRQALLDDISKKGQIINILPWLSRTTLDIIGVTGFAYNFEALTPGYENNELHKAFSKIFNSEEGMSLIPILRAFFPMLRILPVGAEFKAAKQTMDRIAKDLLEDSKATATESGGAYSKDLVGDKSLLSLLLRANMAKDLPEHQRLSEDEVLAQVPTFLVAGHETTSAAISWILYSLSVNQKVQWKLREELSKIPNDSPTMDELNGLQYMDAVIREALRLHPAIIATSRVALKDDEIPLATPYIGTDGRPHTTVRIRKGQTVVIPIEAINRDKTLWGEDALEFKPERWESVPEAISAIPHVWGNTLTFLAGPRGCIGYRFALVEMKAILFTLIDAFDFLPHSLVDDVGKKAYVVQRPYLKSDPKAGNQLPLYLIPHR